LAVAVELLDVAVLVEEVLAREVVTEVADETWVETEPATELATEAAEETTATDDDADEPADAPEPEATRAQIWLVMVWVSVTFVNYVLSHPAGEHTQSIVGRAAGDDTWSGGLSDGSLGWAALARVVGETASTSSDCSW